MVYVLLLIFVALTTGLSFADLGRWSVAAAMVLAGVKALLVALYFMHLRHSPKLSWVLVGAGFYMLGILFLLTLNDLRSREFVLPLLGETPSP